MARYIAAIDQGTTSTRCILFDENGPVASASASTGRSFRAGWVEHDPMEIWVRTQEVVREVLQLVEARGAADGVAGDVAAIGVTNQRETTIVWDRRTGRPYYNAIVWQDTRTKAICDEIAAGGGGVARGEGGGGGEGGGDRFRAVTGLPLAPYFSGTKLRWLLQNVPDLREAAARGEAAFGTVDSWLIWWLTGGPAGGVHVTDVTNASRTMLMDPRTSDWHDGMLKIFGVPRLMLPRIMPSSWAGRTEDSAGAAEGYGRTVAGGPFGPGVPVCGCLGDQHAALLGQCCFTPGESKNTYGTGCFMLLNTGATPVALAQRHADDAGIQIG